LANFQLISMADETFISFHRPSPFLSLSDPFSSSVRGSPDRSDVLPSALPTGVGSDMLGLPSISKNDRSTVGSRQKDDRIHAAVQHRQ
jgi:hypothetical protein